MSYCDSRIRSSVEGVYNSSSCSRPLVTQGRFRWELLEEEPEELPLLFACARAADDSCFRSLDASCANQVSNNLSRGEAGLLRLFQSLGDYPDPCAQSSQSRGNDIRVTTALLSFNIATALLERRLRELCSGDGRGSIGGGGKMLSEMLVQDAVVERTLPVPLLRVLRLLLVHTYHPRDDIAVLKSGLNLRNLCWHGFLSPRELPRPYHALAVLLLLDVASHCPRTVSSSSSSSSSSSLPFQPSPVALPEDLTGLESLLASSHFLAGCRESGHTDVIRAALMGPVTMEEDGHHLQDLWIKVALLPLLEHALRCRFVESNDHNGSSSGTTGGHSKLEAQSPLGAAATPAPVKNYAVPGEYYATLDGFGQRHLHQLLLSPQLLATTARSRRADDETAAQANDARGAEEEERGIRECGKRNLLLRNLPRGAACAILDLLVHERGPRLRAVLCHGRGDSFWGLHANAGNGGDEEQQQQQQQQQRWRRQEEEDENGDHDDCALLLAIFVCICCRYGGSKTMNQPSPSSLPAPLPSKPPPGATSPSTGKLSLTPGPSPPSPRKPSCPVARWCEAQCSRVEDYVCRFHPTSVLLASVAMAREMFQRVRAVIGERCITTSAIDSDAAQHRDGDSGGSAEQAALTVVVRPSMAAWTVVDAAYRLLGPDRAFSDTPPPVPDSNGASAATEGSASSPIVLARLLAASVVVASSAVSPGNTPETTLRRNKPTGTVFQAAAALAALEVLLTEAAAKQRRSLEGKRGSTGSDDDGDYDDDQKEAAAEEEVYSSGYGTATDILGVATDMMAALLRRLEALEAAVAGGTARTPERRRYVATLLLLPAITDALELLVATAAVLATASTANAANAADGTDAADAEATTTPATCRAAADMPAKIIGQMLSTATAFSRCCISASPTFAACASAAAAHKAKAAKQPKMKGYDQTVPGLIRYLEGKVFRRALVAAFEVSSSSSSSSSASS